jgi:hypothetical protein
LFYRGRGPAWGSIINNDACCYQPDIQKRKGPAGGQHRFEWVTGKKGEEGRWIRDKERGIHAKMGGISD